MLASKLHKVFPDDQDLVVLTKRDWLRIQAILLRDASNEELRGIKFLNIEVR